MASISRDLNPTEENKCQAALSFSIDKSGSMVPAYNPAYWRQQIEETAQVVESQETADWIAQNGSIALHASFFEDIAGELVGWQLIRNQEDAKTFANELRKRANDYIDPVNYTRTDLGILASLEALNSAERKSICDTQKLIIDISTDGQPKDASYPEEFVWEKIDEAVALSFHSGVNINVLPVGLTNQDSLDKMKAHITSPIGGKMFEANWTNYYDILLKKFIDELSVGLEPQHSPAIEYDGSGPSKTPAAAPAIASEALYRL